MGGGLKAKMRDRAGTLAGEPPLHHISHSFAVSEVDMGWGAPKNESHHPVAKTTRKLGGTTKDLVTRAKNQQTQSLARPNTLSKSCL